MDEPTVRLRPLQKSWAGILVVTILQSALAVQAFGQEKFLNGRELPMMALNACETFEAAKRQAEISRDLSLLSLNDAKASSLKEPRCRMILLRARLLSIESIAPYSCWAATYDQKSLMTVERAVDAQTHVVNYSYQLQRCRFFLASAIDKIGEKFEAWVELPERPYLVSFLEENGKR